MTYQEDSKYISKAVTLLVTKDDCAAVCDVHIPLVESMEIGVGRAIPTREPLATPVDCAMCAALVFQENRES